MEEKILRYPGVDITVTYSLKRCIHAAECVKGLPLVFDANRKPWVDPDQASAEEVAEVIGRCPTGALKYVRHDDGPVEAKPSKNSVRVEASGPLYVYGAVTVKNAEGETVLEDTRIAFCRCGASKNKPFCDGSHTPAGFEDPGVLGEPKLKPVEGNEEPGMTVVLAANGPLLCDGVMEIAGTEDGSSQVGRKAALCRCGASSNKPYCDGTHKTIGFTG